MTSMSELMCKLTQREQERLITQQEAQMGIQACRQQVNEAAEELMEYKRGKDHELKVLRTQYEKQFRDTAYACRQRVQQSVDAVSETTGKAQAAEQRRWGLETQVSRLRLRVMELEECMQRRQQNNDNEMGSLSRTMDARLGRVTQQTDSRRYNMTSHALKLRDTIQRGVSATQEELQDQTARAHVRAEGRTRFMELCDLAERTKSYDMSQESFAQIRDELLGLWTTQGTTHSPMLFASPRGSNCAIAFPASPSPIGSTTLDMPGAIA